ncbi:MAG: TIGR01777 family oxidoreductase [Chitinophagales bacterium]|nr:TIGR01777 family oxidoreductase [Chitinophagales bacterium]MDW8428879.1 TIGR01777 family oxidoreductase [Chitinophagales bacterium]
MAQIVLAGGNGFLGKALAAHLAAKGYEPVILTRKPKAGSTFKQIVWDGATVGPWAKALEGAFAVINLAGASVSKRHTNTYRQQILSSRLLPTQALGNALTQSLNPPQWWLNASGINIYSCTSCRINDEQAPTDGTDFLAEVCRQWEWAASSFKLPHTRLVLLRTALVFGRDRNSVLSQTAALARWGLAGTIGKGTQQMAWIHVADYVAAVAFILEQTQWEGPVNVVAPGKLTNAVFSRAVRRAVGMPIGLPAWSWMVRVGGWILDREAELLLASTCAVPRRLLDAGFAFRFCDVEAAVADVLQNQSSV